MLLKRHVLDRIATGEITSAYRVWRRPTIKAGGQLRTPIGVIAIEALTPISAENISDDDARRAGAASRDAVFAEIGDREGQLYRIDFRLAGPDPRVARANEAAVSDEELALIGRSLARLDAASRTGAWTRPVLAVIHERPGTPAKELAALLGHDVVQLKRRVRALKEMGLTESLAQGYRLSPRGRTIVSRAGVVRTRSRRLP